MKHEFKIQSGTLTIVSDDGVSSDQFAEILKNSVCGAKADGPFVPRVGDVVYMERYIDDKDKDGKSLSSYGAGEKIVVAAGVHTIRTTDGTSLYDMHNLRTYELVGSDRWKIVSCKFDPDYLAKVVRKVEEELQQVERGYTKRQWVESVYTSAQHNCDLLRDVVKDRTGNALPPFNPKPQERLVFFNKDGKRHNLETSIVYVIKDGTIFPL